MAIFRRLQNQRRAGGDGGSEFVSDVVEWMVEGSDGGDKRQGLAQGENFAQFAAGGDVAGKGLAVVASLRTIK